MFLVTKRQLERELRGLYEEITREPDIKRLITEALAKDGLVLENIIKSAVTEYCQTHDTKIVPHLVADTVRADAIERLIDDELDLDKIHELVAEKIAARILEESSLKTELMAEVAQQVADSVWENFDMEEFYPVMGEKCIEFLKANKE